MQSFTGRWPLLFFTLWLTLEARGADFVQARLDGLTNTGDVMAYALPATALGLTAYYKDGEGALQFGKAAAISMVLTFGLKYSVRARRPTGELYSFPSGHATITFSSAEFMRKRYGWQFGAPAYLLSAFVGYSRVRAHQHYARDVIAGAAIGMGTTFLLSTRYRDWNIQPEIGPQQRGIRLSRSF